jgi:glyoxylate/hydroxypyruvate reductase
MARGSVLLLTNFDTVNLQKWLPHLERHLPDERILIYPDVVDPDNIDVALVANPPPGRLATLPNLKLIQSLWAGVDALLRDPTLPRTVPLARLVDPALTQAMIETVLTHALMLHRQLPRYRAQQRQMLWQGLEQPSANERTVCVLGLGQLGRACANALKSVGFRVIGWSARPTTLDGVVTHYGFDQLTLALEQSDIVVNLLPLTPETHGILNAQTLSSMRRGSSLINVARGAHVVETALIDALDSGQLEHAVLDVFAREPLPAEHAFWKHPKITVLPHVAATTNPATASSIVAQNVKRLREGKTLEHLVDLQKGY